jgi:multimeric flavodoxin WrbA
MLLRFSNGAEIHGNYTLVEEGYVWQNNLKLQAIQIINDSTMKIMDLLTHNGTVETAMSYAERMNKRLDSMAADDASSASSAEESEEQQKEEEGKEIQRDSF